MLPFPMALKFEKILRPFVSFSKKRYIGWQMNHITDPGKLLTKGMEVARRDGCQSLVKIFKKSIDIIFRTGDCSRLKEYLESS